MSNINRREFLAQSLTMAGAIAAAGRLGAAGEVVNRPRSATDQVVLGSTGLRCSVVGIGTGSNGVKHSSNQVRLGQPQFVRLIRHALDRGITYLDTADQYGAHIYLRDAIRGVDRSRLFIQTKTRATTAEMARADLDRFREELGVDYIDSLLMHCMTTGSWSGEKEAVREVLSEAKSKGIIRAHGVSCHGMDPLRAAARSPWVDIDLARINPTGTKMDGSPDQVAAVLREMHGQGKGVLGMKVMGEGSFKSPEEREASLRYVLGLGAVDAFCIGFESPQQIDEILLRVDSILKS